MKNVLTIINKFKWTKHKISQVVYYIDNNIGDKPLCLTYHKELWTTNNGKLYFNKLLVVPKDEAKKYIYKIYIDKTHGMGKKYIYNYLKTKYIGITRTMVDKVLKKLHKNNIWIHNIYEDDKEDKE